MVATWLAQLAHTESSSPSRLETGPEPRLSSLHGSTPHRHSTRSLWSDTRTVVQEMRRWRSELTARSLMEHGYAPIGQSSKEGAAQVFEAEDRASCGGQQDQQVLNGRVHTAVHVDAASTGT